MRKILVSYYSKTGNTKKVAEKISSILNADIDEITDRKNKKGLKGILREIKNLIFGKTEINYKKDPKTYDLVIIGTPIWAWTLVPAVKKYLEKNKLKEVAFFCTYGGHVGGTKKTFRDMEKLSNKPINVLGLTAEDIKSPEDKINKFCNELKTEIGRLLR